MDFAQFLNETHKHFGINLGGYKEHQLKRRIESLMRSVGAGDYEQYLSMLITDERQLEKFMDKVTINVSEFFRNPDIFSSLEETVMPRLCSGNQPVKIWSAACSNGAEPYSLAIILNDRFPKVSYRIDATDIDQNILAVARKGIYEERLLKNVSQSRLQRYFHKNPDGTLSIDANLKKNVHFKRHDLLGDVFEKDYDLIVCRNVTIYFTKETQNRLYKKFNQSLKKGGVLFIGATENIIQYREFGFEKISHWFYQKT